MSLLAGVDLGGTKTACAFGRATGELLAEDTIHTDSHEGPEAVLERIAGLVRRLAAQAGAPGRAPGNRGKRFSGRPGRP